MRIRRRAPAAYRATFVFQQLFAGILAAALVAAFAHVLQMVLEDSSVDLRHSLCTHGAKRLALLGGILVCHFAALWARRSRSLSRRPAGAACLAFRARPRIGMLGPAGSRAGSRRGAPRMAAAIARFAGVGDDLRDCGADGAAGLRVVPPRPVAGRILSLFVAFLLPSLLLYPSVFFADLQLRNIISTRYAPRGLFTRTP